MSMTEKPFFSVAGEASSIVTNSDGELATARTDEGKA
jgi:hypothetical protein